MPGLYPKEFFKGRTIWFLILGQQGYFFVSHSVQDFFLPQNTNRNFFWTATLFSLWNMMQDIFHQLLQDFFYENLACRGFFFKKAPPPIKNKWLAPKIYCFKVVRNSFPFQLNFMKGLFVCSKRLLLLVDSRCCNNLSTYQLLYSHWHFSCHGNLTGPQIHPISSIQLHFTQNVVGELPFLLH